jgi:hypothetical protein
MANPERKLYHLEMLASSTSKLCTLSELTQRGERKRNREREREKE